jgi:hypothetical protein
MMPYRGKARIRVKITHSLLLFENAVEKWYVKEGERGSHAPFMLFSSAFWTFVPIQGTSLWSGLTTI